MALRDNFRPVVHSSSSYNPVTLAGEGVPIPERAHGVRIVAAGGGRRASLIRVLLVTLLVILLLLSA
jgi:hypothetical protein